MFQAIAPLLLERACRRNDDDRNTSQRRSSLRDLQEIEPVKWPHVEFGENNVRLDFFCQRDGLVYTPGQDDPISGRFECNVDEVEGVWGVANDQNRPADFVGGRSRGFEAGFPA